jgi:hypothetical protein
MDYGHTRPTVVLLFAQDLKDVVYVLDEHSAREWLVPQHAAAVRAMLARWAIEPERLDRFVAGGDCFRALRPGRPSVAGEWQAEGFYLTEAPGQTERISGAAAVLARLGDVDSGIAPRLYILERCRHLIDCLPALQHDPRLPEAPARLDADEDGEGGDDAYDALRFGLYAVGRLS